MVFCCGPFKVPLCQLALDCAWCTDVVPFHVPVRELLYVAVAVQASMEAYCLLVGLAHRQADGDPLVLEI